MSRRSPFYPFLTLCCLLPGIATGEELTCPQFEFGDSHVLTALPDGENLVLTADEADITQDGFSTLSGTVRLTQGGNLFETQALSFDRQARIIRVNAESLFRNPSLIVRSREAEFDLANQSGTFHGTEFTLVERSARGEAGTIRLFRSGIAEVRDVYYTTCAPGSRAWFLEASRIRLDHSEGLGTAKHARLRFGYVPILYAPWFQFPIDDRRRTGFLFPTFGESDNTGIDLRIPFYINLAPNYDLQLTPRFMSDRGTQLGSEGRYLLPDHTGNVSLEYLDKDEKFGDDSRTHFNFEHRGLINRRLAVEARYAEVSDQQYFEDLGGQLEASSITHLERSARMSYAAPAAYTITARVTDYQTVSTVTDTDTPYRRLPELRFEALTRRDLFDTRLGFEGEFVNFEQDDDVPQGQRVDLNPYLRFQQDRSAWYLASQLDLRHTEYLVSNPGPGNPDDPSRSLPLFSAETGLRFERLTDAGERQTLEPHLFYLYVPYRDQDTLPVFDSGQPDFDFLQLFARNRFSGEDRISDANHVTFAFTSRLLDPDDGAVRLSLSLGQIYRFEQPRVTIIAGEPTPNSGVTDFLASMDYRLSPVWRISSAVQWSPDSNQFERTNFALHYRQGRRRVDLAYRYRRDLLVDPDTTETFSLDQADAVLATPVYGGWSVLGRWRYSLAEERSLETFGGAEYQTCCWALRSGYRRYQFNTDREYSTSIYLQLELTGLSRIGSGFQSVLPPLD